MHARDRNAALLVGVTVAFAAFAVGSAPRWAACLSAALGAACVLPYLHSSRRLASGPQGSPLLRFLGLGFAFTLLQLIPWPAALVELASPLRHQLAVDNAAALGESPPGFLPLTMDMPATLVELAKLAGYALFAYACLRVAARRRGRTWMLSTLGALGVAVALTALAHEATGAQELFGLYEPAHARPAYLSPFLNANHLSGFLAFAAILSLGLALAASGPRRIAWLTAVLLCGGVSLLAGSRGGALVLVLGLAGTGALCALQRRRGVRERSETPRSTAVAIGVVVVCVVLLLGAFTAGRVVSELAATDGSEFTTPDGRVGAWRSASALLHDHFATGVGRGAFVHAFPRVHESDAVTFAYLENEYLQAAVDWGVPAAAALGASLVFLALAAVRRAWRSPLEAGALGALAALALQNVVDFSLELPGVALAAIAVTACLVPPELSGTRSGARRRVTASRLAALGAAAAIVALAATPLGRAARVETEIAGERPADVPAAERVFRRHPSDYVSAGLLAEALFRARDPRAAALANRALALNPVHPDLHLLAARILLASQRPDQALVEYGLALQHRRGDLRPLIAELTSRFPNPERAVRGLPLDAATFPRLARHLRPHHPELAVLYGRRVQELGRPDDDALLVIAELERLAGDPARALAAARRASALHQDPAATVALAQALTAAGDRPQAVETLERALESMERGPAETELLLALAEVHEEGGSLAEARDILTRLAEATLDRQVASRIHRKLAGIEKNLGNAHQADWHRRRAAELSAKRSPR